MVTSKKITVREKITFALLAAFAVALLMFALVAQLKDSSSPIDFMSFYAAGTLLRQGVRSQFYRDSAQMVFQQRLFSGPTVSVYLNYHPPFETLIYWPFTYLPYATAYVLWDLLNLIILAWSLYLLKPYAAHFDTASRLTLTLAIVCPLISTLREGQNEIFLLLAFIGAFICLKKRREFAAGCALGAGLFRFQFVLPLLLVFLALKRWRIVLGAAATGALLMLLSLSIVGWTGIRDYTHLVLTLAQSGALPTLVPAMPNVRGFIAVLLAGRVQQRYLAAMGAVASLTLLAWPIVKWRRRRWDPGDKAFDLLFSLSVVVSVMISYHALIHSLILLVLPALLLLDHVAGAHPGALGRWRAMLPLILLFLMTIFLNVEGGNRLSFLFLPVLWLAFANAEEISPARALADGTICGSGTPGGSGVTNGGPAQRSAPAAGV